jgi:putative oxidoreductase
LKIIATIARYLLGILFLVFGSNVFLHFIPTPPMPPGTFGQFAGVFAASGYAYVVGFFQVVAALLLLANRFVPLALMLLGPIIFNILVVHALMAPSSIGAGALAAILWFILFWRVFPVVKGIFQAKVED